MFHLEPVPDDPFSLHILICEPCRVSLEKATAELAKFKLLAKSSLESRALKGDH